MENLTLHDVKFKPWRNGTKTSSTGYGLCVSKKYTSIFNKDWTKIIIEVVSQNENEKLEFNLNPSFWGKCPDIKNNKLKCLFEKSHIKWEHKKPVFKTIYLGDNKFKVFLD